MGWNDALGWAGSAVLVWSLLQTRILRLRWWNLIGSVALIAFNTIARVWPMVGLNLVLAGINIYYLVTLTRSRHDEGRYAVVPVGVDDEFLAHFLRRHAADIAELNPGFQWHGPHDDRFASMIVAGDETVGAVIVRSDPADASVALVELDYVIPRYRDFTPGEFVFRRSRLFLDRGFRQILSPPRAVSPYYEKIGFRPTADGSAYVLDVVDASP
jgi:hypothetical protein